jgi:hypothetical protein
MEWRSTQRRRRAEVDGAMGEPVIEIDDPLIHAALLLWRAPLGNSL